MRTLCIYIKRQYFNLILMKNTLLFKKRWCIMESSKQRKVYSMEHMEMVEKLHEKANISYTDAKNALERSGWDMLEALVLLEREGKIAPLTASTTSLDDNQSYETVTATASKKESNFQSAMSKAWDKIKKLLLDGLKNDFVVTRNGKEILRVQILIAIILCLCIWKVMLAALVIGLILDCRYSFEEKSSADDNGADH